MKTIIENYRNIPGRHCGSTAMRNLLYHYCGLELSEEVTFGLGSGVESIFIKSKQFDPAVSIFGRSITMEADAAQSLGIDYREQPELDNHKAWMDVRDEVRNGFPTMLTGDIFFLDYRDYKVRFPAHRFVLLGFDDQHESAFIADRVDPEPQICSYKALAKSRNPDTGITTFNLWGKFFDTKVNNSLEEAAIQALKRNVARMSGKDKSQMELIGATIDENTFVATGIDGLAEFTKDLIRWHEREDGGKLAVYNAQCIEKFGTGGGNFRKMYAAFLDWAHHLLPDIVSKNIISLAEKSAENWTMLSDLLLKASEDPKSKDVWKQAATKMAEIKDLETELFERLRSKTG
ncbi:MAG: BtrH N-terminal domain-containing protein [Desulfobacterales bacterium]